MKKMNTSQVIYFTLLKDSYSAMQLESFMLSIYTKRLVWIKKLENWLLRISNEASWSAFALRRPKGHCIRAWLAPRRLCGTTRS